MPPVQGHVSVTGTPNWALMVKLRANSVHAPFPEKSALQASPYGSVVRRLLAWDKHKTEKHP